MSGAHDVRIVLCGATGRTGNAVAHALAAAEPGLLAGLVAPSIATNPSRSLPTGVPAFASLEEALPAADGPVVVVDLSHADPALHHMRIALDARCALVVGATGIADEDLETWGERFAAAELGLLHVPNFSIGAVLAMRVATELVAYLPDVEIVETHHDGKRDAPSGTAILAARRLAAARRDAGVVPGPGSASAGAGHGRGESVDGIPVHALRLPGASAHQEIVFGGTGELVSIRHDAVDRSCYAAGVALAARRVGTLRGLRTGLEHVL